MDSQASVQDIGDTVEERSCAYLYVLFFILIMFVYRGLVTSIVGSAILLHDTNIFIFLPALFINVKFPLCQLYQGLLVYNLGWGRDNHTIFYHWMT